MAPLWDIEVPWPHRGALLFYGSSQWSIRVVDVPSAAHAHEQRYWQGHDRHSRGPEGLSCPRLNIPSARAKLQDCQQPFTSIYGIDIRSWVQVGVGGGYGWSIQTVLPAPARAKATLPQSIFHLGSCNDGPTPDSDFIGYQYCSIVPNSPPKPYQPPVGEDRLCWSIPSHWTFTRRAVLTVAVHGTRLPKEKHAPRGTVHHPIACSPHIPRWHGGRRFRDIGHTPVPHPTVCVCVYLTQAQG